MALGLLKRRTPGSDLLNRIDRLERIRPVKRLLTALALAGALAGWAPAAYASGTPSFGSVQMTWSAATTATLGIVTQYSTFTQGTGVPSLLPSAAGVCNGSGAETAFNMHFGAQAISLVAPTACLYKNAVAVSLTTNDSTGYDVYEYLDAAPPAGTAFCAWPNGGASFPLTPSASVTTSARSGNPAAGTYAGGVLTSCAAGASQVPVGSGGVLTNGGAGPGTSGSEEYYANNSPTGLKIATSSTYAMTTVYVGEDVQLNLAPAQSSTAGTSSIMTISLIPK